MNENDKPKVRKACVIFCTIRKQIGLDFYKKCTGTYQRIEVGSIFSGKEKTKRQRLSNR